MVEAVGVTVRLVYVGGGRAVVLRLAHTVAVRVILGVDGAKIAGVAEAVGILGDRILAHRTSQPVLVSLARAGTPLGILARRWWWV